MAGEENAKVWVYFVYLSTLAPWAVMQVFDAIDAKRRHVVEVPVRLAVSFFLITASTIVGMWYVVWADEYARAESATMLLGVVLNSWHWIRNYRGWQSYDVLLSQQVRVCELIRRLMDFMPLEVLEDDHDAVPPDIIVSLKRWEAHWKRLWVNNTVIDNDPRTAPASIQATLGHSSIAGDVLWRMFWLQGAVGQPPQDDGAKVDSESRLAATFENAPPPSHGERDLIREEALDRLIREQIDDTEKKKSVPHLRMLLNTLGRADQVRLREKAHEDTEEKRHNWRAPTADERKRSLEQYDVGQQDIKGPGIRDCDPTSLAALWHTMSWVTGCAPRPMENIWYESSALVDTLQKYAMLGRIEFEGEAQWPRFPFVAEWYHIAGDLAQMREVPLLLSVREAKRYALRLAAVSAILAYHYDTYVELCKDVYRLGIKARWTHGWSGLVSCYSKYWTPGNVCTALLGGLPLLVIRGDGMGNSSVKCLLVGLASESIMSTFLSDARRAARTKELERRYLRNKGTTCRGSGVRCVRSALEALHLPRSASQLDGVVAFSTGCAIEAMEGLSGQQEPRDGNNHNQIEDFYCSSRAYRFPEERL